MMPRYVTKAHLRKFSPIDRKHPIIELVEDENVLFDISISDADVTEVTLHPGVANRVFLLDQLRAWLAEGENISREEVK
jgi:hypothetical protein